MNGEPGNPIAIDSIRPESVTPASSKQAKREYWDQFPSKSQLERHRYRQETRRMRREDDLRHRMVRIVFWFVSIWVTTIILIVVLNSVKWLQFETSDRVLIALLATTTINIIGLFVAVVNYLFPSVRTRRRTR
jgi:hypothetical protein